MSHNIIFSGGGYFCTACRRSWDTNESAPDTCVSTVVTEDAAPADMPQGFDQKVVAFAGRKGSGKDTAADVFVQNGYVKVRMADGLKQMLRALLFYRGATDVEIERYIEGDLKEEPCPYLGGKTMRYAMQSLGDWGRMKMSPDFWANCTKDQILNLRGRGQHAVCADIRYPNEVDAINFVGGSVYMVTRLNHETSDNHSSETEVANLKVKDYLINGYHSAEAFKKQVASCFNLSL